MLIEQGLLDARQRGDREAITAATPVRLPRDQGSNRGSHPQEKLALVEVSCEYNRQGDSDRDIDEPSRSRGHLRIKESATRATPFLPRAKGKSCRLPRGLVQFASCS
jgi:hypothetical protein